MKKKSDAAPVQCPSVEQLEGQLRQERHKVRYQYALRTAIYTLFGGVAAAILVATLWLPVLQIYGSSMSPALEEGQLVVAVKSKKLRQGDVVAFYYNNKIWVERVIAGPGEWVDIDEDGNVFVNGEELEEPYVTEKAFGQCDIKLPYQVPDNQYFVMGDRRATSADSRSTTVGCVFTDAVVGRLLFRVWPLNAIQIVR